MLSRLIRKEDKPIEYEAKQKLLQRLDECLKVHADMLDAEDIGSIYELQDLAKLHYYLKVEHDFTPKEIEELLKFQDPLDVARWCWEENTNKYHFPICDLLEEIHAFDRFEQLKEPAPLAEKSLQLQKLLGTEYYRYREQLLSSDRQYLIDNAEQIAAMNMIYRYMAEIYEPTMEELVFLLKQEHPLKVLESNLPVAEYDLDSLVQLTMKERSTDYEKPSVREHLKQATERSGGRLVSDKKNREMDAR